MEGQIVKIISDLHYVKCDEQVYPCKCRGIMRHEHITPVVGDYVLFDMENLIIDKILDSEKFMFDIIDKQTILKKISPTASCGWAFLFISRYFPE